MAIYLNCFTSAGGVPVFARKKGELGLSFLTVASLNGVNIFSKTQGIQLVTTKTDDWIVVWEDYDSPLTIIGVGKGISEKTLKGIIHFIYNSFFLFISTKDFNFHDNLERIKKEIKYFTPIIDKLLDNYDTELFEFSDCILTPENAQILSKLKKFSEQIKSPFCAVVINHKLAVGTEGWWDLDVIDRKLLIALLKSLSSLQVDTPVYLRKRNVNMAYRFVIVPITSNVLICTICGAEPSYDSICRTIHQVWENDLEMLRSAERCTLTNISSTFETNLNVLGILLINKWQKKYVISKNLKYSVVGGHRFDAITGSHRLDVLRSFYYHSIGKVQNCTFTIDLDSDLMEINKNKKNKFNNFNAIESYWCSEHYKCHGLVNSEGNILCVLYNMSVSLSTIRLTTCTIYKSIIYAPAYTW